MKKLLLLLAMAVRLDAAAPVVYEVRFPNAVHHEAEISVTFPDVAQKVLEVRISRTSPGRYALHEFAKNVYRVQAFDGAGQRLAISRPNPDQWNVSGHDGTVRLTYTLFGDRADGTYVGIDQSHAHLNIPAAFLWARGLRARPVRIHFEPREDLGWKTATQLQPAREANTYEAPNLDLFMDSPVEMSAYDERDWTVDDGKKTQTVRLTIHHQGTEAEVDAYARMVKAVVLEEAGVFGELPYYDHGVYTFLLDYVPWASGDGMEHRDSTYCISTRSLKTSAAQLIGTVAHEFFHCWNVERIRPRSLEPFNFEHASMPEELWFAEGFTSYYGPLELKRAGLLDLKGFGRSLGRALDYVLRSPGRKLVSPVEASRMTSLADGVSWMDPTNFTNTYISYYTYGTAVGLGLDLTLRARFPGRSLDDWMRAMWEEFGRLEKPYTMADLEATLAGVTGDAGFAREFFSRYIRGHDVVDYARLLAQAGLLLRPSEPGKAALAEPQLQFSKSGATLGSMPWIGTPLYKAGISRKARITRLGRKKITSRKDWRNAIKKKKPGDTLAIEFEQRGRTGTVHVTLAASSRLELVPFEDARQSLTPAIREFREAWLGSKAIGPLPDQKQ